MIGAIAGDIIGSVYEANPIKTKNFPCKDLIKRELSDRFEYDLERTLEQIRPAYRFDVSCMGTVPQAVIAFLESNTYEDAVRNAISLGGDSDTLACIAGGIAEAFYGFVDPQIVVNVKSILPEELWSISEQFYNHLSKRQ
jgi:ADP-ribosylglycohydrolase